MSEKFRWINRKRFVTETALGVVRHYKNAIECTGWALEETSFNVKGHLDSALGCHGNEQQSDWVRDGWLIGQISFNRVHMSVLREIHFHCRMTINYSGKSETELALYRRAQEIVAAEMDLLR